MLHECHYSNVPPLSFSATSLRPTQASWSRSLGRVRCSAAGTEAARLALRPPLQQARLACRGHRGTRRNLYDQLLTARHERPPGHAAQVGTVTDSPRPSAQPSDACTKDAVIALSYNQYMIRWQDLDPAKVERAIKALLRRQHPMAQGVDGSGGDEGRDTSWCSPEGLVIFEVKSYTSRLTNSAKRKIKASLVNAVKHQPVRWCLIVPLDPSPAEEAWFGNLRQEYPGVELEWRGRDWLDEQFAAHEELRRMVEGSDYALLQRAREMGQEQAVLTRGVPDVLDRYRVLSARALELSTYWRADVTTSQDGITLTWRERFPGAATLDPVTLTPHFSFPLCDPAAQQARTQLRRAIDFGGDVTVPGLYVERIDVEASEETRSLWADLGPGPDGSLRFVSTEHNIGLPLVCRLELLDAQDRVRLGTDITLTRRLPGRRGITLTGSDNSGTLQVQLVIGVDEDGTPLGSVHLTYEPVVGRFPYAVNPALQLLREGQEGDRLVVSLGPGRLGHAPLNTEALADLRPLANLVAALSRLQEHSGQLFPIPEKFSSVDVADLTAAAKALDGHQVRLQRTQLTGRVHAARVAHFLSSTPWNHDDSGAIIIDYYEGASLQFAGEVMELGPMRLYGPRMRLANRAELEAAVGGTVDPPVRFACIDGEGLYLLRLDGEEAEVRAAS